jgi:hypothetical protein
MFGEITSRCLLSSKALRSRFVVGLAAKVKSVEHLGPLDPCTTLRQPPVYKLVVTGEGDHDSVRTCP